MPSFFLHFLLLFFICYCGNTSNPSTDISLTANTCSSNCGTWERVSDLSTPRYNMGVVVVADNRIYVMGGLDQNGPSNKVEIYNPSTNTWITGSNMPQARSHFGIVLFENKIYAIGGRGASSSILNTVDRYDVATDSWQANWFTLPNPKSDFGVGISGSNIFLLGGEDSGGSIIRSNQILNVTTIPPTITNALDIPGRETKGLGFASSDNHIYIAGGRTEDNTSSSQHFLDIYNPSTNRWASADRLGLPIRHMRVDRYDFGMTSTGDGRLYAIGGYCRYLITKNEEYNISMNRWVPKTDIPVGRYGLGVVFLNNKIYAIGGRDDADTLYARVDVFIPPPL